MEIQLKQVAESSICLEIPIQSDIDSINLWKKRIVTDILLLAYLNKPATLITVDPDKNSVGKEYENEEFFYSKKKFLLNCISTCKHTDLIKLGESYDLELGLLVVTSMTFQDTHSYDFLSLFPKHEEDYLLIKEQVFYCSNDGYEIYWLNFKKPFEDALLAIKTRMSFYEVGISVTKFGG